MIFAAINWLSISINLLLVVFVIVCLLMALLILMQRPKQEGLGAAFGGGVTDQVFGARTTNVLQKGTVYLGSMFFLLSLTLAILIGKQSQQKSLLDPKAPAAEAKAEESGQPEELVEEAPSLTEELPEEDTTTPVTEDEAPAEGEGEETPAPVEETTDDSEETEEAPAEETSEATPEEVLPVEDSADSEEDEADKSE